MTNKKFILYSSSRHLTRYKMIAMRTIFFLTVLLLLAESSRQSHATAPIDTLAHQHTNNKDLIITSDSTAYCAQLNTNLQKRLSETHSLPSNISNDINHLQKEGADLCTHSHIRAGIKRLRRAFYLLKHSKDAPK